MSYWFILLLTGGVAVVLLGLVGLFLRRDHRQGSIRHPSQLDKMFAEKQSLTKQSVVYYRTKDGLADYGFSFFQLGGNYRVYIIKQPGYGDRNTGFHTTHRLSDNGRNYVCWSGTLAIESEARQVAALWADNTQEYIRSGKSF